MLNDSTPLGSLLATLVATLGVFLFGRSVARLASTIRRPLFDHKRCVGAAQQMLFSFGLFLYSVAWLFVH